MTLYLMLAKVYENYWFYIRTYCLFTSHLNLILLMDLNDFRLNSKWYSISSQIPREKGVDYR